MGGRIKISSTSQHITTHHNTTHHSTSRHNTTRQPISQNSTHMNEPFNIIPLTIEARGEVIASNIDEFREIVRQALGRINRDLVTDEQFGQAEIDVKALKSGEDAVKAAKDKALSDAESLHALFRTMDETSEEIRQARIELETRIKKRREEVKSEIVDEYLAAFDIDPRDARKHHLAALQTSIKGKRTVESMRTACRIYQTTQQALINESRASIDRFVAKFGPDLVMDRRELELKRAEAVEAELVRRVEAKRAADAAAKMKAEVDAARSEAAAAKSALAEVGKPPAPPAQIVKMDPPSPAAESPASIMTAADEWAAFKAACMAAFRPLKEARAVLMHSTNIAKATVFSTAINNIWKEEMQ